MRLSPLSPQMFINDLSLQVHLGCTAEERAKTQEVLASVALEFLEKPPGEETDDLKHTICYAEVCDSLRETLEKGEFNLVEKMAHLAYSNLQERWSSARIQVTIHKVSPPVSGLMGGVQYRCGDKFL